MQQPHLLYILFLFALGSCVGSFLNVVVWRLPRVEPVEGDGVFRGFYRGWRALSYPPSHCPNCDKLLKWYDNLPVVGWIKLGGRCRYCKKPFSIRYPIVEAITGLLFVFYYVMFFIEGFGPSLQETMPNGVVRFLAVPLTIAQHWPIYALDMMLIAALLAASLIDAELFIIPLGIPWFIIPLALIEHAVFDRAGWPGALNPGASAAALALGGTIGWLVSLVLRHFEILPASFAEGEPALEVDKARAVAKGQEIADQREYTPPQIRAEMRKEMLFLLPPMALAMACVLLTWKVPAVARVWAGVLSHAWVSGLLGSLLGLLMGGFVVWLTRILGSLAFGREAMGMGDVDLMAAVGAVLGPGSAVIAFFIAPFFGIALVVYMMAARKGRELPFGPYLSLAAAFVMFFYRPIADYLSPGLSGLAGMISRLIGGG